MLRKIKKWQLAGAALVASVVITGCGGDSSPSTPTATPTPVPTPRPPEVVGTGNASIPVDYVYGWYFTTSSSGTLDATVDYTYSTTALLVLIAKGTCTADQLEADQCTFVASSFAGSKPRKVTATAQPAGTFTLIIGNAGLQDEAISFQVVLTPTTGAVGPGVSRTSGRALVPAFYGPMPHD